MEKERIEIIKKYIYENIKVLEDRKAEKEDKKISRALIAEEVKCLEKELLYTVVTGTTKEVEDLRQDLKEIANMLQSYLAKCSQTTSNFDMEIYKLYSDMLFTI